MLLFVSVNCKDSYVAIYDGFAAVDGKPAKKMCGQAYYYNNGVIEFKSKGSRVVIR